MIRDGLLAEPILGYARNYIDLESRYRFPESNRDIVIGNRKEKIIAMAIHPGLEGDNADHPDVSLRAGRWLFVVMPSGEIETRRYSELVLGQLFEAAGFTLEEYTGSGGKWLPVDHSVEQKLRIRSTEEVGLSEPNAPKIKHSGTGEEKSFATLSKERLTENWATKVVLFWIFAVLIFILGIGGYWLSKRRR